MQLDQRLMDAVSAKARQVTISYLCLGLGYTAVVTSDGGVGLAYTYFDHKTGCTLVRDYHDYENCPAADLLPLMRSSAPLERSMALALINALAHGDLVHLPSDKGNSRLFDTLAIGPSTRVAMVGFFKPLMAILTEKGASVEVIDEFRGIGDKKTFYQKLNNWADAALITSTSLLNSTFEDIIHHTGAHVRAALLGPSTPMVSDAFSAWPAIKALAGTVPLEKAQILKAVRHGLGTPYLHKHSKKITLQTESRKSP